MDAETALIKSLLEKHNSGYSIHNTTDRAELRRMKRLCGGDVVAPVVLVNKHVVWTAVQMPVLDVSGELRAVLEREHKARRARDMYRWGVMYLSGKLTPSRSGGEGPEPEDENEDEAPPPAEVKALAFAPSVARSPQNRRRSVGHLRPAHTLRPALQEHLP